MSTTDALEPLAAPDSLLRDRPSAPSAASAGGGAAGSVLVVIPAFNEHRSIATVIGEVRHVLPHAHVLVVDDGSTDGTAELARRHGAQVLRLPYNLGVGGAMRAGYKYAHRNGYDVAVQVDADGQHDPAEIPALLAQLEHADVVIGARFAGRGAYSVRGPRRWAMTALARSVSRRAVTDLTDVTSGFRACNSSAVSLFAAHYPVEYLGDTVEALLIACQAGLRIRQVPVEMRARQAGVASQTPFRASLYLARAVLAMGVSGLRSGQEHTPLSRALPMAA